MKHSLPNWLVVLVAVGGVALGVLFATPEGQTLGPCETEDSTHCYWDADTMGNGLGQDLVNR